MEDKLQFLVLIWNMNNDNQSSFFVTNQFTVRFLGALTLLVGRQEGHPACKKITEWWGAGVVVCSGVVVIFLFMGMHTW